VESVAGVLLDDISLFGCALQLKVAGGLCVGLPLLSDQDGIGTQPLGLLAFAVGGQMREGEDDGEDERGEDAGIQQQAHAIT
jgi:hypothetical protein